MLTGRAASDGDARDGRAARSPSPAGRPITLLALPSMPLDQRAAGALDGVGAGLVSGSPVAEVPLDRRRVELDERDRRGDRRRAPSRSSRRTATPVWTWWVRPTAAAASAGRRRRRPACRGSRRRRRRWCRRRARRLAVGRAPTRRRPCRRRQPAHVVDRRLARRATDSSTSAGHDLERRARAEREQLVAARRRRGEHEPTHQPIDHGSAAGQRHHVVVVGDRQIVESRSSRKPSGRRDLDRAVGVAALDALAARRRSRRTGRARRAGRRARSSVDTCDKPAADLGADRIAGQVPAVCLRKSRIARSSPPCRARSVDEQAGVVDASRRRTTPSARRRGTGRPDSTSTRSPNSHGRPRHPRPTTTPSQPVARIISHRVGGLPDVAVAEHRDRRRRPASARRSRPSGPRRRSAARRCGRAARSTPRPPRRRSRRCGRRCGRSSHRPMRNLAVTGTPYGSALATAARTIARSRSRLGRHRRAAAPAGDLRRRTPEVDVDVVDPTVVAQPCARRRPDRRVAAVDLQAARALVGAERHHPLRLVVAVDDGGRHHHLVHVDQVGPVRPAHRPERRRW